MATPILLKKSSVSGKVPLTSDLQYGEVALNYADGKIFFKDSSNNIKAFLQAPTLDSVTDNGATTTNALTIGGLTIGSAYTLPTVDGSSGYVLSTNGSGTVSWVAQSGGGGAGSSELSITTNSFTGTGSQVNFTLSAAPSTDEYVFVVVNGVVQATSTYSVTGTTLTFSTAPVLDDAIETRIVSGLASSGALKQYKKYVYNITTTTSTITGADVNSNTLAYDVGFVDVYQNGIRLVEGDDYTATSGTSISLTTAALNTDTIEVLSYARMYIADGWYPVSATLTTTTANQVIDTFVAASYSTAKYLCQVKISGSIHVTEVSIMHDGTDVYTTEYGTMFSGSSLGTFTADLSSGNIRLLFSPANINTTVKARRVLIGV